MKEFKASRLPMLVLAIAVVAMSAVIPSCYPNGPESPEDFDIIVTAFDDDTDFNQFNTYALPDSVPVVPDPENPNQPKNQPVLPDSIQQLILSTIETNMNNYGWTREIDPNTNPPDVTLVVGVSENDEYGAYVSYDWYSYYGGWYVGWGGYGAGWGVGYPWAPSGIYYTQTYSYTVGTLLIEMLDLKNPDTQNMEVNALWVGALNGLMSGTNSEQRISDGIVQAFIQSPYLNKNQQP
ncbi:MAG: DUF4136 domain-containing protein [bacterium]|nr:DUF4136 domain-containing protein [bacterium]